MQRDYIESAAVAFKRALVLVDEQTYLEARRTAILRLLGDVATAAQANKFFARSVRDGWVFATRPIAGNDEFTQQDVKNGALALRVDTNAQLIATAHRSIPVEVEYDPGAGSLQIDGKAADAGLNLAQFIVECLAEVRDGSQR